MLGLKLRDEFLGAHMPGTAIALRTTDNQGAAQRSPDHILSITYPTVDVQTALKAISAKNSGRPIVLMGDRGSGKSHIMAVMHHCIQSPEFVESRLKDWGNKVGSDELKNAEMLKGYVPISEAVRFQFRTDSLRLFFENLRDILESDIITTCDFSPGAVKEAAQADKTPIALMNGE